MTVGLEAAGSLLAGSGPTVALLAFTQPTMHWDWPCKDNDEEEGLH